ncbi:MAG: amidohydrolase family protein [Bacteroidales bacterium]|nr:amidohydrolase family protein [Bacteroidales bacterium]
MMRKIAAHYIFPSTEKPIKNGIITLDDSGKILDITQSNENLLEVAGLEFYSGILVPGFVNTHCHLELSHLKGKVREHTGLPGFVSQINQIRKADDSEILDALKKADADMCHNGIVAVADISNTRNSFEAKSNSKIIYHTLLEIFTTNPDFVERNFEMAKKHENELKTLGLSSSIVPHAPYSVTPAMFKLIYNHAFENKQLISIHNQECASENELYQSKSGELYDTFVKLGINFDPIPLSGKNSLESIMVQLPKSTKTILVHNTFSQKEDILKASRYFENLYWCMCPNANLYIENSLPDIPLFQVLKQNITIGTDSLASNKQLSILEELKTINRNFPQITVYELIRWATLNGAEALDLSQQIGSFEIGKTPGVNLIKQFDLQNFKFRPESNLKRLI